MNLRVRTAFVVPGQGAAEASASGVDDEPCEPAGEDDGRGARPAVSTGWVVIGPASPEVDGPASDTAQLVPTVPTVFTPPRSLPVAKRNAVRISGVRPRVSGPITRPAGRQTADLTAIRKEVCDATTAPGPSAVALSNQLDMVPGVDIIEGIESDQQGRVNRPGRMFEDDFFDGYDRDSDTEGSLSLFNGFNHAAPLPFLEVGPVTRKLDDDGRMKVVFEAGPLCQLLAWAPAHSK